MEKFSRGELTSSFKKTVKCKLSIECVEMLLHDSENVRRN